MAQNKNDIAPIRLKLLITIINRNKAEYYSDVISQYNSNMQMSFPARGTAEAQTLQFLGLTDNEKTVLMSIVRHDKEKQILDALEEKFKTVKNGKGVAFTVPMTGTIGATVYRFLCDQR